MQSSERHSILVLFLHARRALVHRNLSSLRELLFLQSGLDVHTDVQPTMLKHWRHLCNVHGVTILTDYHCFMSDALLIRLARCRLCGCKNRPAPFPGQMSYNATKPGLVLFYISACFNCIVAY